MFGSILFPIFLGIVILLFFSLPGRFRRAVLLLASYLFCAYIDIQALWILLLVSGWTWLMGIKMEKSKTKAPKRGKIQAVLAIGVCVALLMGYKYVNAIVNRMGWGEALSGGLLKNLLMPAGLSFYIFQAIGYLMDIMRGKSHAEKNFFDLSCYFAFFPKLVSGPIERQEDFLPQIKKLKGIRFWDRGRLSTAFTYMLWGYFMKMVVADRLAIRVNILFESMQEFDSFWMFIGMVFYAVQIYCDFAGYSYIAVGCAKIFGIELTQNFKAPYQADGITDFWRRWHISLSSWLRDYLYIPLGGNRKGIRRKCINTMVVFLVCGMWHGVGFHFIAWGMLHGIYSILDILLSKAGKRLPGRKAVTFFEVAFAWIFFRAESMTQAFQYVWRMLTAGFMPGQTNRALGLLELDLTESMIIILGITLVWLVDKLADKRKMHFPFLMQQRTYSVRYFVFYLLILVIFVFGIYGPGYQTEQFIYMQF